jgi:hypothetical protein
MSSFACRDNRLICLQKFLGSNFVFTQIWTAFFQCSCFILDYLTLKTVTSYIYWAKLSRFHLKNPVSEISCIKWNTGWWIISRIVIVIPPSQTYRCYIGFQLHLQVRIMFRKLQEFHMVFFPIDAMLLTKNSPKHFINEVRN